MRETANAIQEVFSFATRSSLRPRFDPWAPITMPVVDFKAANPATSVTLFSGGVDSLCGMLSVPEALTPTRGIFVSHANMRRVVEKKIAPALEGLIVHTVSIQRNKTDVQQLRGFVYLCFGAILAKLTGANSIVISETGPTMYQPQYLPTDLVTVTTNPFLVELTKSLLERVLECKLQIFEPFENMTKAETMANCPQKQLIKLTNSCITSMFSNQSYPNCGQCLGCVIRRLSAIVAQVDDSQYAYDVAVMNVGERIRAVRTPSQSIVTAHHNSNLLMLLRFAKDMITGCLPDYTVSVIQEYKKEDLFRRFALDIFAAASLLTSQTRNAYLKKFYSESLRRSIVSKSQLEDRIAEVRECKYRPDFNPRFS
jgi:hypothetical protein